MSFKYLIPIFGVFLCSNSYAGELKIGAGIGMSSPYEGSDKYILIPDAMLQYTTETNSFGLFSIGTSGARWQFNLFDNIHIALLGTYMQGRKEEIGFSSDKNEDLKGMGDLKGAAGAGVELSYSIVGHSFYINSLTALGHRDYGGKNIDNATRFELGINSHFEINKNWSIDSNISTRYINKSYSQAYFGVTEKQSLNSDYSIYTPNSGIKDSGVLIGVNYKISERLFVNLKSGGYYLFGDMADSPITKQKYGLVNIIGLSYVF